MITTSRHTSSEAALCISTLTQRKLNVSFLSDSDADPSCFSDFPSLSGAPRAEQANAAQNVWERSRTTNTNPPVQRPPGQGAQNTQQSRTQLGGEAENVGPSPFGQMDSTIGDYRFDDQGATARNPRRGGQQGGGDEFPPLGDFGGRTGQGGGQASHLQGLGGGSGFLGQPQRNGGFGGDAHADSLAPNNASGRVVSPSDAPSGGELFRPQVMV